MSELETPDVDRPTDELAVPPGQALDLPPTPAAERVTTPSLFVHSDGCVFPDHVRQVHAKIRGAKELVWSKGDQIDFYDQPQQVDAAMQAITAWFGKTL